MMRLILIVFLFASVSSFGQTKEKEESKARVVEASCGQCNFGLKGKGCSLAVRMDNKAYYVKGATLDDHGDAHAAEGFCSVIRKAEVTGEVKKGRYQATSFKLLPIVAEEMGW